MKVIAGVFKPTIGRHVERQGVLAPLIELGAGFDPQYTGMENIYPVRSLSRVQHKFIDEKLNDIIEFSELKGLYRCSAKELFLGNEGETRICDSNDC